MKIELEGVSKQYGQSFALRDVTLEIPHGQRVTLIGPNGSGKSTLLRIVMGLLSCEGKVRLDGQAPFADRQGIARRLAYVPQTAPQLGATVREVVRLVATLRDLDVRAVATAAEQLDLALEPIASRPFRQLSGGMKQKLLVALAFSSRASLLILDEPTASLDAAARERFVSMLDDAAKDATVILCSHRPEDVQRLGERAIELAEGRVIRDLLVVRPQEAHGRASGAGA